MIMANTKNIFFGSVLILIFAQIQLFWALSPTKFALPKHLLGTNERISKFLQPFQKIYNPIDLGKGIPDFEPPNHLKSVMANVVWGNYTLSQYTSSDGKDRLKRAIAKFYSNIINQNLHPNNNVIITLGATEALFATVQSHTNPGDEWIIIDPCFNLYIPIIKSAHGVPRFVPLKSTGSSNTSRDWTFDREEMRRAFNHKTKAILFTNPHNPLGKIFTREELEFIANLAKKWDTLVVSDEVYEFQIYDNNEFIRIATLPGMFERTLTISSVSKTFSATGYRLGWVYGGTQILNNLRYIQNRIVCSVPTFIQEAFAVIFENELTTFGHPHSYFNKFRKISEAKRNYLIKVIKKLGMSPIIPEAGYFIVANLTTMNKVANLSKETGNSKDYRFVEWMIKNVKLQGYPLSFYYNNDHKYLGEEGVRFTFIKSKETLESAEKAVQEWITRK